MQYVTRGEFDEFKKEIEAAIEDATELKAHGLVDVFNVRLAEIDSQIEDLNSCLDALEKRLTALEPIEVPSYHPPGSVEREECGTGQWTETIGGGGGAGSPVSGSVRGGQR